MLFELSVIILTIVFLLLMRKLDSQVYKVFIFTFLGVLVFEYFTQALWHNVTLEPWAYLYLDVSWVITLGWTLIIVVSRTLIDLYFPKEREGERFLSYLIPITIIGVVAESMVVELGIRQYPEAVQAILSGITVLSAPIETLYYIPVFVALVIAFSRYWEISLSEKPKSVPAAPAAAPAAIPTPVSAPAAVTTPAKPQAKPAAAKPKAPQPSKGKRK